MRYLQHLSRERLIALILVIFAIWCGISWRWYTCGVRGFCGVSEVDEAAAVTIKEVPLLALAYAQADNEEVAFDCEHYMVTTVTRGERNDRAAVTRLEHFLTKIAGEHLATDGMFGRNDIQAVEHYQRTRNLPVTGNVGPETIASINRDVCAHEGALTN